ncbi:MAG: hypothetical protein Q9211_003602 [Gyalolechia sp. 1 TL-2023]
MPPPLSMEPPPSIERNGPSYVPPPSALAAVPHPNLSTSPQEPSATSTEVNGKKYSLEIIQQPVRARMCGFGDKDRRPITPPPCIRLIVRDANPPYDEIDMNQIDTSFFVLTVDLWNAGGDKEVNLVRHSQSSPSISAATSASYPPPNVLHNPFGLPTHYLPTSPYAHAPSPSQMLPSHQQMYSVPSVGYHPYQQQQPIYHQQHQIAPPPLHTHQQQAYYGNPSGTPMTPAAYYGSHMPHPQAALLAPHAIDPHASMPTPQGMFTRNLIGSLGVSAFKLTDTHNNMGIWFILQDLSVRTEGIFRLKMNFVNVGSPTSATSPSNGSAPVLASCFSKAFQVYSAKKFPGVIESTGLSKCFATQGIKIPIRKDGPRGNVRGDEEDEA